VLLLLVVVVSQARQSRYRRTEFKMPRGVLLLLVVVVVTICQAQEDDDNTKTRILSNQNTAAVTGAALGLGIGIAGSILVGKIIEDATKCKPQDVQPPAFGRFLPDLLNLHGNPCRTRQPQSSYRQPQQYPSPGYVIPSPSTQYQQAVPPTSQKPSVTSGYHVPNLYKPTISGGYTVPNLQKPTVTNGYNVPNVQKPTFSSGYFVPNLHQVTVSNGFKVTQSTSVYQPPAQSPKNTYSPVASGQDLYTQSVPHKASVDPPKDVIELVNNDYTEYNEYPLTPNFAIQPRNIEQEDLVKTGKERKPKSLFLSKQTDQSKQNSPNTFTLPAGKANLEPKFSQAAAHKPQVDAVIFESSPKNKKNHNEGIAFEEARAHKSVTEAPRSSSSLQANNLVREAKQERNTKSIFHQTESHKAEPDTPLTAGRQGKSLSNLEKSEDLIKFDPVSELGKESKNAPFTEGFQPITGSVFSPVPETLELSSPSNAIARAKAPKLFGKGILRLKN